MRLSIDDLRALPRATAADGRAMTYEGVLLAELLKRAGAKLESELTGEAMVAELDPAFTTSDVLIADTINGRPLGDKEGPLRIVVPHDKRAARSVRMLTTLEVVQLK